MTYSEEVIRLNPELHNIGQSIPSSKYHNARTDAKGLSFQSGHEAAGVANLILLEEQHKIFGLRLQVRFPLPGKNVYVADAVYLDKTLQPHVVDFKGYETPVWKIKKRLFKETYGQEIEEYAIQI